MQRIIKISLYSLVSVLVILLATVAALPTLISQPSINQFLLQKVNSSIAGKISVQDIQLGWLSGVHLKNIEIQDSKGRAVASVKAVDINDSLLSLLYAPTSFGHIAVDSPKCTFIEEHGDFSINQAFEPSTKDIKTKKSHAKPLKTKSLSASSSPSPSPSHFNLPVADVSVENGSVTIVKEKSDQMQINNFRCKIVADGFKTAKATITGEVVKGTEKGTIAFNLEGQNFADENNRSITGDCIISHLPIVVADNLIAIGEPKLQGILQKAIGTNLDATIKGSLQGKKAVFDSTIESAFLQGKLALEQEGNQVKIATEAPGTIRWQISPDVITKLGSVFPELQNIDFLQSTSLQITLKDDTLECANETPFIIKQKPSNRIMKFTCKAALKNFLQNPSVAIALHVNPDDQLKKVIGSQVSAIFVASYVKENKEAISGTFTLESDNLTKPFHTVFLIEPSPNHIRGTLTIPEFLDRYIVTTPFTYKPKSQELHVDASMKYKEGSEPPCLTGELNINNGRITTDGSFDTLPIATFAKYIKQSDIVELIGDSLSGKWDIDFKGMEASGNKIEATVKGKDLAASVALNLSNGIISGLSGKTPVKVQTSISPARFASLVKTFSLIAKDQRKDFDLRATCPVEFSCRKLQFPIAFFEQKSIGQALDLIDVEATIDIGKITLGANTIYPLHGFAELQKGSRKVACELKSKESNQINIEGHVQNLWNDTDLQFENSHIELEANIQNFPLDILERFTVSKKSSEKLAALVGDNLNAEAKLELKKLSEGKLNAMLAGENTKLEISSRLQDGFLRLNKPITARVRLSEESGKVLFKDLNPLLATSIHADHPVELFIDNNGFQIPVRPFTKQKVQIKNIRIDLGKLHVKKGGALDTVTGLLNIRSGKEMHLWFTPLFIEVNHGIVHCKRVDALLDNTVQIASWGTIDLNQDRVNMVVGILGEGLAHTLQLKGLSPDYVLQLPLTGTTLNASIDVTRATAKIASLRMMETTNQTQAIIGGLLGVAASVGDKDAPVPPPTTKPFPWERSLK